jgi:glutamate/tyrosine decarboxylase-like PLP-dependent enzyme
MASAVNENTVFVAGSAVQYPQGVIDPIPEIAALAASVDAWMHVDACMGGFILPFMELNGEAVPPWDFRVPGVMSMSIDVHKLGYAPKGSSVIVHASKALRRYQTFVFDGWLGGLYASPNIQGSRSGLPMATAWAVMHHLGIDGYRELTRATIDAARRLVAGVRAIPGLTVLGEPDAQVFTIAAEPGANDAPDVFALGDALLAKGWLLDRQTPPDSLHATVSAANVPTVAEFLADLAQCAAAARATRTDDRSTNYATLE